jgi:hypothetical protein
MGKESEVLGDIRDLPLFRWEVLNLPATNPDPAMPGFVQSHDRFEDQRFSAPCGSKKKMEFLLLDLNVEILDFERIEQDAKA